VAGRTSQWARGTSSLGGGGFFVLLLVVAVAVVLGGLLFKATKTSSAYTISFLGTATVAILSMLFLIRFFDSLIGIPIIVVLTAVTYTLAHWVTTKYIDDSTARA
ncbi:MAG: hypothetical protein J2O46_06690, partial [Nocardioides sp.]|nr:hypothetical protein [Nocardioides sp.]